MALLRNEKWYNCDLPVSHNIGARYCTREIINYAKSLTGNRDVAEHGQLPALVTRHQQTPASLIALSGCSPVERAGLLPSSCQTNAFTGSRHFACCLVVGGCHKKMVRLFLNRQDVYCLNDEAHLIAFLHLHRLKRFSCQN